MTFFAPQPDPLSPAADARPIALARLLIVCFALLAAAWPAVEAFGQATTPAPPTTPGIPALDPANPFSATEKLGQSLLNTDFSTSLSIIILLTVLSLAPAILILMTSFTRIVVVLSLLRQAIGTQTLPPSQVIVGLSLFMTILVMTPTFERINAEALGPLNEGKIKQGQAWVIAEGHLRDFMFAQIDRTDNWSDLYMILNYRGIDTSAPEALKRRQVDNYSLIPAFILSELKTAFLIGFRIYLPFLVIDMIISSLLISMGMMMLPPVLISLPFKLLLFVLVDGWQLVVGNLLDSFERLP